MNDRKALLGAFLLGTALSALGQTDNETLGTNAGSITSGDRNVLLGDFAAPSLSTSSENLIAGAYSGWLFNNNGTTSPADQNVILGFRAAGGYTQAEWVAYNADPVANPLPDLGGTTATFDQNVFIGYYAGLRNRSGTDNVFIGAEAGLSNNATDNTFIGTQAGMFNTTGSDNTFVGEQAGFSVTTASDNTFLGEDAGSNITTGRDNTAVGANAMGFASTTPKTGAGGAAYANTVIGSEAGYDMGDTTSVPYNNTFVGSYSGTDNGHGFVNTFVGAQAGSNSEYADYCTFVGAGAGWDNNRTNEINGGNRNTYLGVASGFANRKGSDNVALGSFADFGTWENADQATIDGALAGGSWLSMTGLGVGVFIEREISRTVMIGSYSTARRDDAIAIGFSADATLSRTLAVGSGAQATHTDAIAIGHQAASHGNNIAVIGNSSTASIDPGADGTTSLGSATYRYASANAKTYHAIADTTSGASMSFVADQGAQNDDTWRLQASDSGAFTVSSFATGAHVDIISAANTGDVTVAGDLNVNSDGRLKENVKGIENALDVLGAVEGRTYHWKKDLGRDQKRHYGLVAQEVEKVVPELVTTSEKDGIKSVNYQGFVPILINAVDELKEQNMRQSEEIELLRQQISVQQELLQKLSAP